MHAHYISFDIEDWFQVPFAAASVPRDGWEKLPSVVADGTAQILGLLKRHDVTATFFVVGWIAERYPDLVRRIRDGGHEIGSHSYAHQPLDQLTPEAVDGDTARSSEILEKITGTRPLGYRAPLGSIGERNAWALDILKKHGFQYDSSIYPANPFVYSGMRNVPTMPYEISPGFWEIPLSVERIAGAAVPLSGGFYLRLLPLTAFGRLLARKNARAEACVLYYHPWEFATEYPRPIRHPLKRFIQYYNLKSVAPKLDLLLSRFRFRPLRDALRGEAAS
jgi:polysaccharide deacetylase family protein (PEP-CTERM system associated)